MFRRQGYALLLVLVLLPAALLGGNVSPVNAMLNHLQNAPDPADALLSTGVSLIVAVVLPAAGAAVTQAIAVRRR